VTKRADVRRVTGALAAALLLGSTLLWAQTQAPGPAPAPAANGSGNDIDNLFNDNGPSAPEAQTDTSSAPQAAPAPGAALRPDDPTLDNKIHTFGSLSIYGLLGTGWSDWPVPGDVSSGFGNELSGSFTASLGFQVRPAPQLRIRGTLSYSFPTGGPQFSELIIDYSVREAVFFRMGTFDYTWGNSQFFQFSNLPSRSIPGWAITNQPIWQKNNVITIPTNVTLPASVKMSIPIGLDSIDFLARFDMQDYGFPSPTTPDPRYAGYGLQFSVVTGPIEWILGGFFQYLLTPRSSLSLKTHFLGFDFSAETTMAYPITLHQGGLQYDPPAGGGVYVGGSLQRIYPTAVVGLSREWSDLHIKLSVEYGYNSEKDAGMVPWLVDETGPGGHNTAVVARFADINSSGITLNALWQHNWSDGSGLISPFLEFSPVPLTTIQFGPAFVYGADGSESMNNRLVPGSKRAELLLLVRVSDSYSQ
jgi:hypothetical protein